MRMLIGSNPLWQHGAGFSSFKIFFDFFFLGHSELTKTSVPDLWPINFLLSYLPALFSFCESVVAERLPLPVAYGRTSVAY